MVLTAPLPSGRNEIPRRKVSRLDMLVIIPRYAICLLHIFSVSESTVLRELLDRYIHPTASDPIVRHQLSQYVKAGDNVHVLMKDNSQLGAHR